LEVRVKPVAHASRNPFDDIFVKFDLPQEPASSAFVPLSETATWHDASRAWTEGGTQAFAQNRVPFFINNNGHASIAAARTLVSLLDSDLTRERASAKDEPIYVAEIGAGTGLFARYFLDEFRELAPAHYERITYVATDGSATAIEHWKNLGIFASHEGRVLTEVRDARDASGLGQPLRAVFANYILDVLPLTIVRKSGETVQELRFRNPRRTADGGMRFESTYVPFDATDELIAFLKEGDRAAFHFGGLEALDHWVAALDDFGFFLVNDFGPVTRELMNQKIFPSQYGKTLAVGLNFPLLDAHCHNQGWTVTTPKDDAERGIHSRLVSRRELPSCSDVFANEFSLQADADIQEVNERASELNAVGRQAAALSCFREALKSNPYDWVLAIQASDFVSMQLGAHEAGLALARRALQLNPWYSAGPWNAIGNCLFQLGRFAEALDAHQHAEALDNHEPNTPYFLARVYLMLRRYDEALEHLERAVSADTKGRHTTGFLELHIRILRSMAGERISTASAGS
jgi:tetratricopeptide (TPR) repeat protein